MPLKSKDDLTIPLLGHDIGTRRKYISENGLHLFTGGPAIFRPSDLYKYGDQPWFKALLEGTNIYMICRRPRISVCTRSIQVTNGVLRGRFVLHGSTYLEWDVEPFSLPSIPNSEGRKFVRFAEARTDSLGHSVKFIDEFNRPGVLSSHIIVSTASHALGDKTRLEVMYVGQAFGKSGERVSADRLKRHNTLQRILSDCLDDSGSTEILLLAFQYGSAKNHISSAGSSWVMPEASDDEELLNIKMIDQRNFDRKTRITLAEAVLINYFKPAYNEMHRDSIRPGNNRKLKTLRAILDADMSALIVEVNTSNIRSKLWSSTSPQSKSAAIFDDKKIADLKTKVRSGESSLTEAEIDECVNDHIYAHVAMFSLFEKSERESFLHGLQF